jgi:hypothetical protein
MPVPLEEPHQSRERGAQLVPRHDRVEVAEAEVLLGEAEVVRQPLPRRLLHDARAGERDQRARLRERHVAERGERREDPRGRRVRHHDEHRAARVVQVLDRADRLRHLHQREDPLLHARAARARHRHERDAALGREVARARELLADDGAHRPGHEGEVHHRDRAAPALDLPVADHDRVALPRLHLRLDEPVGVGPQIEEVERVVGAQVGRLLDEAALVEQLRDPLVRPHREVVAALAAETEVLGQLVVAVVRPAGGAGVRVALLRLRLGGCVPVLDRDVYAVGHGCSQA